MPDWSDELVQRTTRLCQPSSETPISEEAAREVLDNLTALLRYLSELEQKYGQEADD